MEYVTERRCGSLPIGRAVARKFALRYPIRRYCARYLIAVLIHFLGGISLSFGHLQTLRCELGFRDIVVASQAQGFDCVLRPFDDAKLDHNVSVCLGDLRSNFNATKPLRLINLLQTIRALAGKLLTEFSMRKKVCLLHGDVATKTSVLDFVVADNLYFLHFVARPLY